MGPGQLLQLGDAKFLDGLVLEVDGLQRPHGRALGLGQEVEARHDQMEMFGVGEVGDEGQDQADGDPPADVRAHGQLGLAHARPELADGVAERLPRIAAVLGDQEALAQHAEPDVAEDEDADDQRIAGDAALLHLLHQRDVVVVGERLAVQQKAAHQEVDHADQHRHGEDIGQQAIEVAGESRAQEGEVEESLENIGEVDQEVEDEAPGDHGMEDAGAGPCSPDRPHGDPLKQRGDRLAEHALGVEGLALSAPDDQEDFAEAQIGKVDGKGKSNEEEYFFRPSEHGQCPLISAALIVRSSCHGCLPRFYTDPVVAPFRWSWPYAVGRT